MFLHSICQNRGGRGRGKGWKDRRMEEGMGGRGDG